MECLMKDGIATVVKSTMVCSERWDDRNRFRCNRTNAWGTTKWRMKLSCKQPSVYIQTILTIIRWNCFICFRANTHGMVTIVFGYVLLRSQVMKKLKIEMKIGPVDVEFSNFVEDKGEWIMNETDGSTFNRSFTERMNLDQLNRCFCSNIHRQMELNRNEKNAY